MPGARRKSLIEQLHTTHKELEVPEKAARPPPPPMETRPDNARRSAQVDEVERLRSMIAYGESQRQRILVDHMKLLSEYNILKKVCNSSHFTIRIV